MAHDAGAPARVSRGRRTLLVGWPLLLSLVLLAPLRHPGHLLARDLVFVPHEPLTVASIGLGGTAPRAVPLDAVVASLTCVVDGGLVGRFALVLTLACAGWGVLRLTAGLGTTARLAASGFAVWNPFVVERMALGQWALVLAYAALPWLLLEASAHRRTGSKRSLGRAVVWSAAASLTPTGGLLAVAGVAVAGVSRARRTWWLLVLVVILQLPWVVPSLVGGAGETSDPAGVAVFAPGSDAGGHPALALLGLGGIWDGLSVPGSRHTPLAVVAIVVVAGSVVVGVRRWWSVAPDVAPRLATLGLAGLLLALALTTGPGQDLLRHAVTSIPGAGLVRDAQKLLAPFVLLVACLFGATVEVVARAVTRRSVELLVPVGLLLVLLPVGLVPDAGGAVWHTVHPVELPAALDDVVRSVDAGPADQAVVTLPWRSYRNFSWGSGYPSSDPLVRMVDRPVVTSDDLAVGRRVVRGESRTDARVGTALEHGRPSEVLPRFGVGWVVVYADDPAAGRVDVAGLRRVLTTPTLDLYAVPGAVGAPDPATWRVLVVVAVDVVALLTVLGAAILAGLGDRSRRAGRRAAALLQSASPSEKES